MTSGPSKTTWLRPQLRRQRRQIALGSVAAATQTGCGLAAPYLFKIAVDRAIVPDRLVVLNQLALAYLGLAMLNLLAARIEILTVGRVGQQALHAVRCRLFAHLQRLPLSYYQRERTGAVVARITADVEAMTGLVSGGLVRLANDAAVLAGIAIILIILDWQLALAVLTVSPLVAIAAFWFQRTSAVAWRQVREATSTATATLHAMISGVREIQGYGAEEVTLARIAAANERACQASTRTVRLGALFFPSVEFASAMAFVVVLGFGSTRVLAGELGVGTLTAFLLYLGLLFGPVLGLSEFYDTVQSAVAGAERIGAVLAMEPAIRDPDQPAELRSKRGEVRLVQVRFAYPGPDGEPGPEVLHGVDIAVPPGQTLALVGPTGAGKSTIAGLLLRFHDPLAGRVTLDGLDLRQISMADLRGAVSFVPQDGFLFSGTVEDNIRFGCPQAARSDIEAAIAAIGAWPLISRLPAGLDSEVGERGKRLASGERQIIALARAWIADPAVLVLDEATSRLDPEADARVSLALRRLRADRTTVLIAHRISSVMDADQVAVITDGTVAELGPPAELLASAGRFADLYNHWNGRST